jgi:hypothetical protein
VKNERFFSLAFSLRNRHKKTTQNGGSKEEDDFEDEDEDGGDHPFFAQKGGGGLVQTDRETVKIFTGEEKVTHGWVEERFNRAIEECDSIVVVKGKRRRRSRENDDDEREDHE